MATRLSMLTSLFCMGATLVAAQGNMAGHDMGTQMKEMLPPEKLPVPIRMNGIGNSHLAITATSEAQIWFDQGLNLLHDFWNYESERAFEQAIRVDPQCAMCQWGLYQALTFRNQSALLYSQQALANAVRLKDRSSKAEQLYIEAAVAAAEAEKAATPGSPAAKEKEIAVWRRLVKEYPADLQAKIFLAGATPDGYDDAGLPKKGSRESIAILQDILKTAPNDSAANHYWIHAVEPGLHPEQAVESAALLASLAPASGHMVHMPGHIYYRMGDYAHAERWFAESTAVDERYMREQHVDVDDDWNYVHNLMYAIANLMEQGKLAAATTLSAKLSGARGQLADTLYVHSPRDGFSRLDPQLPVALRIGDWGAVLKMLDGNKPDARLENLTFLSVQLRQFATGMQAIQANDLAVAQSASTALDAELWHMSQEVKDAPTKEKEKPTAPPMLAVMPDAQPAPLLASLSIMSLELRATILAAKKQLTPAKALFTQAAKEEKALGYREPPTYIRPVGETEGLALLAAGDNAGAHQAYTSALAERPNSGFGLYGLARSSEAAGNNVLAMSEYSKFVKAWIDADPELPEMLHARKYIAGQTVLAHLDRFNLERLNLERD